MTPPTALRCPRDQSVLVHENLAGTTVDRCTTCEGIWLDAAELEGAVQAASEAAETGSATADWEAVTYLRCPHCDSMMARKNHMRVSGVIVDACPKHGTWLDAGELERLGAFIASGGGERAQEAEAALRQERAKLTRSERPSAHIEPYHGMRSQSILRRMAEDPEYQEALAALLHLLRDGGF